MKLVRYVVFKNKEAQVVKETKAMAQSYVGWWRYYGQMTTWKIKKVIIVAPESIKNLI